MSNVAWGGDERLYVTASDSVLRVDVSRDVIPSFSFIDVEGVEEQGGGTLGFLGL